MERQIVLIDFDSTFTKVEALDILGEIALENHPEKDERLKKIADITDLGMSGEYSFTESLKDRIALLDANKSQIEELISRLKTLVSESTIRNKSFFEKYSSDIYIVSSGFKEFIVPVVADFGIPADQVYANKFEFNENGDIINFDKSIPLSEDQGKVKLVKGLNFDGDIHVIGDGYTDYEIRGAGLAKAFYAFIENKERPKVTAVADHIIKSFDEFIEINNTNFN